MPNKPNTTPLSIQRNMIWNSAGSFINLICQWLITVLVVRLSSKLDAAGQLSLAMSIANVFAPIAMYKMRSFQVSDINKKTSAREYIGFRLFTIALGLAVSLVYSAITIRWNTLPVVILYLLYKAVECLIDVYHGIDQQNLRMDFCGKSLALRGVLSLVAFSLTLSVSDSLLYAVGSMTIAVFPVIFLDRNAAAQFDNVRPHITRDKTLTLLTSCFPAVVGTAFCTAVVTLARQNLDAIYGTAALGIYASVCAPVVIVQAGAGYIYAPLLGVFASLFEEGNTRRFVQLLFKVTGALILLTIAGCFAFYLFGEPFLSLIYGEQIASHSYLMHAAAISVIMCAYASFLTDILIAMRLIWSTLIGNALSLLVVMVGSTTVIQLLGVNGTSVIASLAFLLGCVYMLSMCLHTLKKQGGSYAKR